ncbi:MAG: hypothetical protein LBV30_10950 [Propionibacteriaceae bacterium]|jgi:drug/metabolite transporter (DMT)-like permease|nr:hypothetical protein [Propionibacteriaceae bacterium]
MKHLKQAKAPKGQAKTDLQDSAPQLLFFAGTLICVGAVIGVFFVLRPQPTSTQVHDLLWFIAGGLLTAGVVLIGSSAAQRGANSFMGAILSCLPMLLISILEMALPMNWQIKTVLRIITWGIAIAGLVFSAGSYLRTKNVAQQAEEKAAASADRSPHDD